MVDLESLALGALLGILVSKERQVQEGFLGFLACLEQVDPLVSKVTGEYLGTLGHLGWEWRDQLDQLDLMDHPDQLGLENQGHKDSEDLQGNTVVVVCLVVPAPLDRLAIVSFVKHLKCKQTEEDKRKDKLSLTDPSFTFLKMDHACWKHSTTAKVVTNVNCQVLDTCHAAAVPVILVTNIILFFISHHLCVPHSSPFCALVPYDFVIS